jgi:nitric oxide reductase subunit B
MTEWVILFYMIREWKLSFSKTDEIRNTMAYRFLISADNWVLANLVIALLISIPAINLFTHGTHITVAHSMGTTVGINTSILFASLCYILVSKNKSRSNNLERKLNIGFYLFNISLGIFLSTLLIMGINKSFWQFTEPLISFSDFQNGQHYYFVAFAISGTLLALSLLWLVIPLLKQVCNYRKKP